MLDERTTRGLIRTALQEDLAYGPDVTSLATVSAHQRSHAQIVSRGSGIVAAGEVIEWALSEVIADNYEVDLHVSDGERVVAGTVIADISAPTRGLLTAERTLLNLLTHACGIATETRRWVDAVAGTGTTIRDSRKTLPGMRNLQKYAVSCGGGMNHRMGLGDEAMIKDNHVAAAGGVVPALARVRKAYPELRCEVEVDNLTQLSDVLAEKPELVLLDNFELWETQVAAQKRAKISPATQLESSGGLTLEMAREYARCGVDFLAVGALTHSVRVLDLGLDF
ncbi:carboxylating nicotinate-nucleotide diphosphorylase [Corynebacterium sp. TAE3-ERU12]|uniref:carboxylating nicotinate-nucleotide diphosphorylase n=1 Tax=Corynebacterium sp. TAE3-ERU12 TaxID=2849491 RepID=UPI001C47FB56|nr:carboxylating nicotinate-nucleotide diphosphorylase [Corynebacterium sp. TAE3-ERU12]MBV7296183.1 carboxylating nicotinate-nucleotide diphosphorylase [Corynebacterium sp. TAE3-ERU12]